jgi:hypothetical protein
MCKKGQFTPTTQLQVAVIQFQSFTQFDVIVQLSCIALYSAPCCCYNHPQEVLDWFEEKSLRAYSISAGQSLLYNDIFPKHKERLGKKMSELVVSAAPGSKAMQHQDINIIVSSSSIFINHSINLQLHTQLC